MVNQILKICILIPLLSVPTSIVQCTKKRGYASETHIGPGHGGKSTKIQLGSPIIFKLTAGQYNDSAHAVLLLE